MRVLHPLWDLGVASSATRSASCRTSRPSRRDNPEFLLALLDARPAGRRPTLLERVQCALPHRRPTHAFMLEAAVGPDRRAPRPASTTRCISSSPTSRRRLAAARSVGRPDDRAADRPGPAAQGGPRPARPRRRRGLPATRAFDPAPGRRAAARTSLDHELAGAHRRGDGATRAPSARQRVERLMGDYFRHARAIDRGRRVGAARGPLAGRPQPGPGARRHPLRRPPRGGSARRRRGWARSRPRSKAVSTSPRRRCRCIQQHADRYRCGRLLPDRGAIATR